MSERVFEIGLVLSGTVSSGAYTAGVIDFLFEALREWYAAKKDPDRKDSVPDHDVVIKVVAGNSGGALTACLIPGAACGVLKPFNDEPGQNIREDTKAYVKGEENRLYQSWVRDVDIRKLLGLSDLKGGHELQSILNSDVVEEIADKFASVKLLDEKPRWIGDSLHFYLMYTNLDGVPYNIDLNTGMHYMRQHSDYRHFILSDIEPVASKEPLLNDNPVWLDPKVMTTMQDGWKDFRDSALASGAFPVALKSQKITRQVSDYAGRLFSIPEQSRRRSDNDDIGIRKRYTLAYRLKTINPNWKKGQSRNYSFNTIDGGIGNNDPLEFVRLGLTGRPDGSAVRAGDLANRAAIMISPLNGSPLDIPNGGNLMDVLNGMLPTFLDQTRFKLTELQLAQDRDVYSRKLISPTDGDYEYPIYCSALSAFGGFFLEELRHHDYMLGRRNCQQFLREHFDLPVSNPIVRGYGDRKEFSQYLSNAGNTKKYKSSKIDDKDNQIEKEELHYQIIPLVGTAAIEIQESKIGRVKSIPEKIFSAEPSVEKLLKQRLNRIMDSIIQQVGEKQKGFKFVFFLLIRVYAEPLIWLLKWWLVDQIVGKLKKSFSSAAIDAKR